MFVCFFEVGLVLVTEYKIKMKQTNKTVNLKETKIKLKNPREKDTPVIGYIFKKIYLCI